MRSPLLLPLLLFFLPLPMLVAETALGAGIDAEIYPTDSYWEPDLSLSLQIDKYLPISRDAGCYFDGSAEVILNPLSGDVSGNYALSGDISLLTKKLYIRWLFGSLGSFFPESTNLGFDVGVYLSLGSTRVSFFLNPCAQVDLLPAIAFGTTGDLGLSWSVWQQLIIDFTAPFKLLRENDVDCVAALGGILGFSYYPPAPLVLSGECGIRRETSTELGTIDAIADLPVGDFWELMWGLDISLATVGSAVCTLTLPGYLRRKDHGPVIEGVLQTDRNQWDLQLDPGFQVGFHPAQDVDINVSMAVLLLLSTTPEIGLFAMTISLELDVFL